MRLLFWKAFIGLLVFDMLLLGRRFARLHHTVHSWPVVRRGESPFTALELCDAVNHACIWYPKRVLCLQRAAVTACLLRNYGLPAEMVLGAQKFPFKAHAWVEVNGRALNERRDVRTIYGVWERC